MKEKFQLAIFWFWLLALSVLGTIYLAWILYPIEVDFLNISKAVFMSKHSIIYNFNDLMDYLTNPMTHKLVFASFRSSKEGLAHFQDVKLLFHFCQLVGLLLAFPAIRFLVTSLKNKSIILSQNFFRMAFLLPLLIALFAVMIGFDNFFTLFHQILFPGKSNWSFNPNRDPIIWILPEEYFMHCFVGFLVIYEVLMATFYLISSKINRIL